MESRAKSYFMKNGFNFFQLFFLNLTIWKISTSWLNLCSFSPLLYTCWKICSLALKFCELKKTSLIWLTPWKFCWCLRYSLIGRKAISANGHISKRKYLKNTNLGKYIFKEYKLNLLKCEKSSNYRYLRCFISSSACYKPHLKNS